MRAMRNEGITELYNKTMIEAGQILGESTYTLLKEGKAITSMTIKERVKELYADREEDFSVQIALALLWGVH